MRILKNPKRAVRWYVGLCLFVLTHCLVACSTQHPEVEKAAQTHLEQWKEYSVLALQTGGTVGLGREGGLGAYKRWG